MPDQLEWPLKPLLNVEKLFDRLRADCGLPEAGLKTIIGIPRKMLCDHLSGREHSNAAEGATDSETLRQKDRFDE